MMGYVCEFIMALIFGFLPMASISIHLYGIMNTTYYLLYIVMAITFNITQFIKIAYLVSKVYRNNIIPFLVEIILTATMNMFMLVNIVYKNYFVIWDFYVAGYMYIILCFAYLCYLVKITNKYIKYIKVTAVTICIIPFMTLLYYYIGIIPNNTELIYVLANAYIIGFTISMIDSNIIIMRDINAKINIATECEKILNEVISKRDSHVCRD